MDCTNIARFTPNIPFMLHGVGRMMHVACSGSYKAAASLMHVCCMGTGWCACAVLQVNGTEMPSGNGAEHHIHEHIAKIRQRDERIVIKFEGAVVCVK